MFDVNWLAVIAAAVSSFVVGGIWYSPVLFGPAWQLESGVTDEQIKSGNPAVTYGGALLLSLVAATVFAIFLGREPDLVLAVSAGFSAGLFWVGASLGINYLFERKSLTLFLINAGYHTLQFTVIGLVLGLWH